jgi:hypothetical protein
VTALTISGKLRTAPADKELLAVPVFKLADEHPMTKAGLRCVYVVEKAELEASDLAISCSGSLSVALSTPAWRVDATE